MPRKKDGPKVEEAKLEYLAERRQVYPSFTITKMSSKNQLTLPVAYVRDLGLEAGDEVVVWLEKGHITLERRLHGKELLDSLQGSVKSGEWSTREGALAWIKNIRDEWEREVPL